MAFHTVFLWHLAHSSRQPPPDASARALPSLAAVASLHCTPKHQAPADAARDQPPQRASAEIGHVLGRRRDQRCRSARRGRAKHKQDATGPRSLSLWHRFVCPRRPSGTPCRCARSPPSKACLIIAFPNSWQISNKRTGVTRPAGLFLPVGGC